MLLFAMSVTGKALKLAVPAIYRLNKVVNTLPGSFGSYGMCHPSYMDRSDEQALNSHRVLARTEMH